MKKIFITMLIILIPFTIISCNKTDNNSEQTKSEVTENKEEVNLDKLKEEIKEKVRKEIEEENKNKDTFNKFNNEDKANNKDEKENSNKVNNNQNEKEHNNEQKLNEAFKKQHFLENDNEGRRNFQKDQNLDNLLELNLNMDYNYQPYLDEKGNKGISVKICFKDLGGSKVYYREAKRFVALMNEFRIKSSADIKNLYIYNLDNSANMTYKWNENTEVFEKVK